MGLSLTAPLTWVSGSVVYAEDFSDAWAVFRVGTENYDTQPEEQREGIQRAFAQCSLRRHAARHTGAKGCQVPLRTFRKELHCACFSTSCDGRRGACRRRNPRRR